jgi:hypothetical protein
MAVLPDLPSYIYAGLPRQASASYTACYNCRTLTGGRNGRHIHEPFHGKFLDLVMLLIPGGRERTVDEYRALFGRAGFELTRIVPTGTEVSIVEGRKR